MRILGAMLLISMLLATVASALLLVWARHERRVLFVELSQLQKQRDELNTEYGRLELEQATWAEPRRIDELAHKELGMISPRPQDVQLVTR